MPLYTVDFMVFLILFAYLKIQTLMRQSKAEEKDNMSISLKQ